MFNIKQKTGEVVFNTIKNYFENLKIWNKVVFLCNDGELAMTGQYNGFSAFLIG